MFSQIMLAAATLAAPAPATDPRDVLTQAVFTTRDKAAAIAQIAAADAQAVAVLARQPADLEAQLTRAMAIGYLAKLNRNRGQALAAKAQFESIAAQHPRDPDAQAALGGFHLGAVAELGGLMARGALGARKAVGLEAVDRAVALGGNRALFLGMAALMRLDLDPADPRGAALADAATKGTTPTALDRIVQRRAAEMLVALRGNDARLVKALAHRLLPLGQIAK